jgi:alcohol dehydrogenase
VREITGGGAHLSLDALGSPATCVGSVHSLRTRGRHVQVGLMPAVRGHPAIPMDRVVAAELAILGSHGMAAHEYGPMLALIADGRLRPDLLVRRRIALEEAGEALAAMDSFPSAGMTVVDRMGIPC